MIKTSKKIIKNDNENILSEERLIPITFARRILQGRRE